MTITREQLELAAMAGGIGRDAGGMYVSQTGGPINWRPHTDIADAARLAVRLGIRVSVGQFAVIAQTERAGDVLLTHNGTETNKERVYCHAITLCAAGVGRRMKEAK